MTNLEISLFVALAVWIGAVVMRSDNLISDLKKRLEEVEKRIDGDKK